MSYLPQTIASLACVAVLSMAAGRVEAQSGSRSAAIRNAQQRGQQIIADQYYENAPGPAGYQSGQYLDRRTQRAQGQRNVGPQRLAQGSGSRSEIVSESSVVNGTPIQHSMPNNFGAPIMGSPSGALNAGYSPRHLQVSSPNLIGSHAVVDDGAPIVSDDYFESEIVDEGVGCFGCDGGCGGDCGPGLCGCGDPRCFRSGGCGPCAWSNCWIRSLGGIFSNAELFAGAQGFRSRNFTAGGQTVDDSSFGYYGGLNLGLPMCPITCGLFSGQVGIRSSQSEFEGDFFSNDNRDQLFVTAGAFRRVDYGLQIGVVGDFFHEEWFVETDLAQVRGDIGWVYPGGNAFGFRFAAGTEDDLTNGIINGTAFNNLFAEVIDNYRFYYRFTGRNAGFCDAYAGWTDADHAVLGLDCDMPLNGVWAMQSGFNYFLPDTVDNGPTSTRDSWNVFVGIAIRPQGFAWYGNYDRPLLNVADNGTFVFGRN